MPKHTYFTIISYQLGTKMLLILVVAGILLFSISGNNKTQLSQPTYSYIILEELTVL